MIANSHLTHEGPMAEEKVEQPAAFAPEKDVKGGRAILFATPTCPNCRIACQYMDKAGFAYEKLMAAENAELARKYGVKQAPTLVLIKDDGIERYRGVSDIKGWLMHK